MVMFQYMNDTVLFNRRRDTAPNYPLRLDRARSTMSRSEASRRDVSYIESAPEPTATFHR
jgi:hypothetical protein